MSACWFVYVVVNPAGRTYVGVTRGDSPDRRVAEHNGKKAARSTRGRGPWSLAYAEKAADRSAALSREWHLKRDAGTRRRIARSACGAPAAAPRET